MKIFLIHTIFYLHEPKPPKPVDACDAGCDCIPNDGVLNENDGAADDVPNPPNVLPPKPPNAAGAKKNTNIAPNDFNIKLFLFTKNDLNIVSNLGFSSYLPDVVGAVVPKPVKDVPPKPVAAEVVVVVKPPNAGADVTGAAKPRNYTQC